MKKLAGDSQTRGSQPLRPAVTLALRHIPGSDDSDATRPCPVGPRGDGGKMAAAGSLERSFVELSGAERERPRHFREFTARGVGTERAWGNGSHCFPSGSSSTTLAYSLVCPSPHVQSLCVHPTLTSFSFSHVLLCAQSVPCTLFPQHSSVPDIPREPRVRADHIHFAGTANAVFGAVKYSESAGGFYYVESGKLFSVTRNRFIHW